MRFPICGAAALLLATAALSGAQATAAGHGGHASRVLEPRREAECHTRVLGSHARSDCFNGDSRPDRVQLHVMCARWWDPAMDTAPVTVGPAGHVTLTQRCWLEVRKAWVTHTPG
ncbi:hypothetical protein [Streptomyces griseocarneus]|uniref:hypothetical protein n=1 Tax=Streptomyces griseocarneus TaxID=51201 RepID=UPI00167CF455|nr:hypothetical protein [Streptomyces griseocarneus]MBZ6471779.1 hypothetical protein [Streptomyces griseocarneus]GHG70798.1 hypothetical protein GCM10018779_44970 [Streptomyces griseocarneus]